MSFKRFDAEDVVVSAESVASPVWSGDVVTLQTFFTSSTQVSSTSGQYYYNVFQTGSTLSTSKVQFAALYADKKGSGSLNFNINVPGKSPSSATYGQYRNLVLGDEEADFTFGGKTSEHFFVISIDRARYKEKLLPGTLDLVLKNGTEEVRLTDNSKTLSTVTFSDSGRVYDLVSGSLGNVYTTLEANGYASSGSYGKFLPDIGIIILNGEALDNSGSLGGINLGINRNTNAQGAINLRTAYNIIKDGGNFRVQSEETVSSNFVFVRARNAEFNYSTNPSNITGSGELRHNVMIDSPQAYVTAVGLYNDNNDLLGVAKLSRPLLKDFTKESLIRIKLDY